MANSEIKKVAIVWANPYNKNLGVAALAYSALSLIADVFEENKIKAEFWFYGSSNEQSDSLKIGKKEIKFSNLAGRDLMTLKSKIKSVFFPSKINKSVLKGFDFVFDIAEGDSFTDIYGNERFNRILNSKLFFDNLGKTQVLLPQTIGPFNDPENEKAAFNAMSKLKLVISRDRQSFNYTQKFLPADKIREAIDVAFYMPYEKGKFKDGINIGINVSGLLWNGGYTKDNQFKMKTDYRKLIEDTLAFFNKTADVKVHLIPHVVPTDHAVEDDYVVSEEIAKEFPNVIVAPRFKSPIEAKGYISGLDFFTGARMHACIAAFSTGVPVYPMAYSRKFNGLFSDTLQYKWMGDCVNQNEATVLAGLIDAFNNRETLKKDIDFANDKIVKPRIEELKSTIKKIITS